eukprot:scaffold29715_cov71-Phaeocystis_antarctica.AAC.1
MLQWLRVQSVERRLTSCRDATRAWEGLRERTRGIAFSGGGGANRGYVGRGEAGLTGIDLHRSDDGEAGRWWRGTNGAGTLHACGYDVR